MTKATNRAYSSRDTFESCFPQVSGNCIFISHKYEDLAAAYKIAEYIMEYGIDVYLDDQDLELQKAVQAKNPEKIVACIEDGLKASTHILVLVTEHTRMSWRVPYETGYAKMGKKKLRHYC